MIKVDIHTKRISSTTRIYVVRPGPKYRYFDQFIDNSFVGPDLPGLDLPEFNALDDIPDLTERLARSIDIKKHALSGEDGSWKLGELDEYTEVTGKKAFGQYMRLVRGYFGQIKSGDLVIVPPANFRSYAQIGEVVSAANDPVSLTVPRYPEYPLSGRRVKWLASLQRSKLPANTLDALQKPSALLLLELGAYPNIFRRAYGSYVTDNEFGTRLEVSAPHFRTIDDFRLQAFIGFVTANTSRVSANNGQMLGIQAGAFSGEGVPPELFTNVNSPGGLSLKSVVITPIVIAVMMTLATDVGAEAQTLAAKGSLVIENSHAPDGDACTAEVNQQVITQLQLLGYDNWVEACQIARAAAESTGVSTSVQIIR